MRRFLLLLVAASVQGQTFPAAWGRTVKEAESWAAYEALLALGGEAPGVRPAELS